MIKNGQRLFLFLAILSIASLSHQSRVQAAGVPTIMSYQGRLADSGGNLLGGSSGTAYYFRFSIWNVATGGTAGTNRLWPSVAGDLSSVAASVRSGVFTVNIGDTDNDYPYALDYDFNASSDIYLQVEVSSNGSSFQTLSPRQRISAAPFARLSGAVSGADRPSSFGTVTPFGTSVVSVQATSTNTIALTLRGILNQLANIFQVQNSLGANLFSINSTGKISATSTDDSPQFRLSNANNTYGELYTDAAGDVRISSTGGNIRQNNENLWICSGGGCDVADDDVTGKGNIVVETGVIFDNKFELKQIDASTTVMYDTIDNAVLEFDEGQ